MKWLQLIVMYSLVCESFLKRYKTHFSVSQNLRAMNTRPIIGILAIEQSLFLKKHYFKEDFVSYLAASYVKDVESSGARVVPIMIGKNRSYYEEVISQINGVVIPGGGALFNQSNGYADAGQHIYEIALELNKQGDYFPVFGICSGLKLLILLAAGQRDKNLNTCYSYANLPLVFTRDYRNTRLFKDTPDYIISWLRNKHVTVNAHQFCVGEDTLLRYKLTGSWHISSYGVDNQNEAFISSVEHIQYPLYGIQFHPEKSAFEWKSTKDYPHYMAAVKANKYFMDFFVEECRNNHNKYKNPEEEAKALIYNYPIYYTGLVGSAYMQCYMFESKCKKKL